MERSVEISEETELQGQGHKSGDKNKGRRMEKLRKAEKKEKKLDKKDREKQK